MKRLRTTFLALMISSSVGCSASPLRGDAVGKFAPLVIIGVSPGMKEEAVTARLGPPVKRSASEGFISLRLVYQKAVVGFDEDGLVAYVEFKANTACILNGICLGASDQAMQDELDRGGYLAIRQGDTLIIQGDGCWGDVKIRDGVATSVSVRCSP